MSAKISLALVLLAAGCAKVGTFSGKSRDAQLPVDGSIIDAARAGDSEVDATRLESGVTDATIADGAASCPQRESTTVALYSFDGVGDALPATAPAAEGFLSYEPTPCGQGLRFVGGAASPKYAYLPFSGPWKLASGSVAVWVKFDGLAPLGSQGIVGRDAAGGGSGHLMISRVANDRVHVRFQPVGGGDDQLCSAPLASGWHRVVVNFGGGRATTLAVDGQPQNVSGVTVAGNALCGSGPRTPSGIDANDQPWVIGALSIAKDPDPKMMTGISEGLNGWIDALHIRSARLD
ncbi:MAG: hypothetical protein H6707_04335 [Deltaproteobacteria bacterium]|nr:hypothetical protein [Deltaproteobacteria bacterium]